MPKYVVLATRPFTLPGGRPVQFADEVSLAEKEAAPLVERGRLKAKPSPASRKRENPPIPPDQADAEGTNTQESST